MVVDFCLVKNSFLLPLDYIRKIKLTETLSFFTDLNYFSIIIYLGNFQSHKMVEIFLCPRVTGHFSCRNEEKTFAKFNPNPMHYHAYTYCLKEMKDINRKPFRLPPLFSNFFFSNPWNSILMTISYLFIQLNQA